jgi:hypothetical protein
MYTHPGAGQVVVAASATADVIVEANVSTHAPTTAKTTSIKPGIRDACRARSY